MAHPPLHLARGEVPGGCVRKPGSPAQPSSCSSSLPWWGPGTVTRGGERGAGAGSYRVEGEEWRSLADVLLDVEVGRCKGPRFACGAAERAPACIRIFGPRLWQDTQPQRCPARLSGCLRSCSWPLPNPPHVECPGTTCSQLTTIPPSPASLTQPCSLTHRMAPPSLCWPRPENSRS